MIKMTNDQWIEQFRPLPNHLNQDYGFDFGNGCCLFETFGEDIAYIYSLRDAGSLCIWTVIDHEGEVYITEGYHFVNRIGHIVTEKPYIPGEIYIIDLD